MKIEIIVVKQEGIVDWKKLYINGGYVSSFPSKTNDHFIYEHAAVEAHLMGRMSAKKEIRLALGFDNN